MRTGLISGRHNEPAAMESLEPRLMLAALPVTLAEYADMAGLAESIGRPLDMIPNGIVDAHTVIPLPEFDEPDFPESVIPRPIEGLIHTGRSTDLAIMGGGMFIVDGPERFYTRDGRFNFDDDTYLVTADGMDVMGYAVDAEFNIVEGELSRLQIPLNRLVVARQTSWVVMDGQLGGDDVQVATLGTILQSDPIVDVTGMGGEVTASSRLVDLGRYRDGRQIFFEDTTLSLEGLRGEGRLRGLRQLDVDADTTAGDLMEFMLAGFGINLDPSITPPGARQAGASVVENPLSGAWVIQIIGNVGQENAIRMGVGGLRSTLPTVPRPLAFQTMQSAVGTSTFTSFLIYDSLGNSHKVDLTFVLESQDNTGRTWRFFANSLDDTGSSSVLGTGAVHFDVDGNYAGSTGAELKLDLDGGGVQPPMVFSLDLSRIGGIVNDYNIRVMCRNQNGEPPGTLMEFTVEPDGRIIGLFDSGYTRLLGQVALAAAPNGWLRPAGDGLYRARHPRRGIPLTTPQAGGAGEILQGYYEEPIPQSTKPGPGRWRRTDQASLPFRMQWRRDRPLRGARRPAPAIDLVDLLNLPAMRI